MVDHGILQENATAGNIVAAMPTFLRYIMKDGGDKYVDLANKWTEYFILMSTTY